MHLAHPRVQPHVGIVRDPRNLLSNLVNQHFVGNVGVRVHRGHWPVILLPRCVLIWLRHQGNVVTVNELKSVPSSLIFERV